MTSDSLTSRRRFLGALGAGAAAFGAAPVFSIDRVFAQAPAKATAVTQAGASPVHLNYNENPYGPSPKAIEAIRRAGPMDFGRYYADSYFDALKASLAEFHKV